MTPYYEDDHVVIYHGDCRELIPALTFDVVVTDPPYGRNWRQGTIKGHALNVASGGIANDRDTTARDDALALIGDRPTVAFGDLMLPPPPGTKLTCVYHKADGTTGIRGAIGGVRRDCEAIYLIGKGWGSGIGGRSSLFTTRRQITGSAGVVATNGGHPHTKPDDVMHAIVDLCPPGIILDPFMGLGDHTASRQRPRAQSHRHRDRRAVLRDRRATDGARGAVLMVPHGGTLVPRKSLAGDTSLLLDRPTTRRENRTSPDAAYLEAGSTRALNTGGTSSHEW